MRAAGGRLKGGLAPLLVYFVFAVPMVVATAFIAQGSTTALAASCSTETGVGPGGGAQQIGDEQYDSDQLANAQTITTVAVARGLPRRAAVLGIATAMVESGLRNLGYGDRDSLGLFQQRPSQGWGSPEQILNPTYAAGQFYDHLVRIPGWNTMLPGQAEQAVQNSGFPGRYAPRETAAAALAEHFWQGADNPVPTSSAQPIGLATGGCPDVGSSDLPLDPNRDPTALPQGFQPPADPTIYTAVIYALAQVGKPYLWGATGPDAFDCSGLTQAAWAHAGVAISRTTASQSHDGVPVGSLNAVLPGDLLFIPGDGGTAIAPGHVGLYAGSGVVVDAYDTGHGVITEQLASWAPKVVAIRRIVTVIAPPTPAGDPRT